jgi:hypothetical protein
MSNENFRNFLVGDEIVICDNVMKTRRQIEPLAALGRFWANKKLEST